MSQSRGLEFTRCGHLQRLRSTSPNAGMLFPLFPQHFCDKKDNDGSDQTSATEEVE
jgi:hypothetical protein